MTREFFITSAIIGRSCPLSPTRCPVGLALRAGGVHVYEVGFNFISCSFLGRDFLLPLPSAAFDFLRRHDAKEPVEPTTFSITFLEEPPRPLPKRFRPNRIPKTPALPIQPGIRAFAHSALPTFTRLVQKVPKLLPTHKPEPVLWGK